VAGLLVLLIVVGALLPDPAPAPPPPQRSPAAAPATSKPAAPTPAPAPAPEKKDAACRQNLRCWGEKHLINASVRCDDQVEAMAQYSAEWTDGFFEPKFSRYKWLSQPAGTVTYFGDKVRFQNGFGAWQNMVYACDYDPESDTVLDVTVSPGRLPQ